MNLTKYIIGSAVLAVITVLVFTSTWWDNTSDHAKHLEPKEAHSDEKPLAHSEAEGAVDISLNEAQRKQAGIKVSSVLMGTIPESRRIYGEIHLNEDQVIHKYPKYPGTVREVRFDIGDKVGRGDTLAIIFNTETLSLYSVISGISGEILEKHAVAGEFSDGSEPLMIIGNLESVWIDLNAFENDRALINTGQNMHIYSIDGSDRVLTKVRYIKPVMDVESRTYTIRCTIDNSSRNWNPGRLVYAEFDYQSKEGAGMMVPSTSIQVHDGNQVVFIPEGDDVFELVQVIVGKRGREFTEIISGLERGDQIVSSGAFFLKSQLLTQSFSGHAGHGH